MYALIGVMHMVDGMILNKVDFESFSKKHQEVILNSFIWNHKVQIGPNGPSKGYIILCVSRIHYNLCKPSWI